MNNLCADGVIHWIRNDGNSTAIFESVSFNLRLLNFQLNSPNRILLLHLSIVCLSLSILYLWILINNSIMPSPLDRFNTATIPESAAISTATTSSTRAHHYHFLDGFEGDGTSTHSPISDSMHDSVCSVNDLLIHLLQPIGLWTISCINFDRYYAICSPLHYNTLFTTKKVSESKIDLVTCGNLLQSTVSREG